MCSSTLGVLVFCLWLYKGVAIFQGCYRHRVGLQATAAVVIDLLHVAIHATVAPQFMSVLSTSRCAEVSYDFHGHCC